LLIRLLAYKLSNHMNLYSLTIKSAGEKLKKGEATSVEITESIFSRIEKAEPDLGAFITLTKEQAMKMAEESDKRRGEGKSLGELDGIPIAVKDLFSTKGIKTTAGSEILSDFTPIYESTSTEKLWKAGAVLIGKTNMDQFAMGSSNETSAFLTSKKFNSTTRNPWDLDRVPGGSSGGSAVAVAGDMCFGALGTDTGGSIRQPASFCGITGLKPTYGRISRYGVIAMASSLDQVGPMTKTAEDSAILLKYLAGHDKLDSTSSEKEVPDYSKNLSQDLRGLKIGIPEEFFKEGLDPEVKESILSAISILKDQGAKIVDLKMPLLKHALAIYYILMPAEVSSNLARFDGIRYGKSVIKNKDFRGTIEDVYKQTRENGFGSEAKRRIMLGSYVLSAGYYDAYYKKAQKVRSMVRQEFDDAFKKVDIIASAVTPTPAFLFGEKTKDPLSMYLSDIMTVPANVAGIPAISVPAGFVEKNNKKLPVGLQFMGPDWSEQTLLNAGHAFQENTSWHREKPPIANG